MEDKSFLAFSCVHAPLHDPEAIDWLVEQIAARQPDVIVCLGDLHEMAWASQHADVESIDAAEEYAASNEILRTIRLAAPESRRVLLPGNHEARLDSPKIDPRIREAMHYRNHEPEIREHWEMPVPKYQMCRHHGCFRLGQVTFHHGVACSASGIKKEATILAREWGLYIHGHTHRPTPEGQPEQIIAGQAWPLNWWRANPGCLRDMAPDWMAKEAKSRWGQALIAGRAQLLKSPRAKRCWDAESVHFRSYDAWRMAV